MAVLEDQITIGASGEIPHDKPARPDAGFFRPARTQGAETYQDGKRFGQTRPDSMGIRWPRSLATVRRAVALALLVGIAPADVLAQYRHRVVLLEQPNTDEASTEVLARLRGELTAAGFEVVLLPAVEGDPADVSETTARDLHPAAVIFVLERPAEGSEPRRIELWLSDRLSRRTFVQSLPVEADDSGRGYRRLAIQAVELLKARLAELMVTHEPDRPPPKPPAPPKPPPKLPPPPKEPGVRATIAGGVTLLQGFEGLSTSFAPRLSVGVSVPSGSIGGAPFAVDLAGTLVAFGNKKTLRTSGTNGAEARVSQGLGTVEAKLRFDRKASFQPLLSAAAGLYTVGIDGTTQGEHVGHDERTWSMFTSVGAGLWVQPAEGFALELGGQVGRAWAKTIVRIDDVEAAEAGAPLVLLSLAAVGIF
jgi:hypothetical protein